MQCGCPVVTSHDPAVVEVSGGVAIHAGSTADIAQALKAIAANPERRRVMHDQGLSRVKHFSWDLTARKTRELYQEVLTGATA